MMSRPEPTGRVLQIALWLSATEGVVVSNALPLGGPDISVFIYKARWVQAELLFYVLNAGLFLLRLTLVVLVMIVADAAWAVERGVNVLRGGG